MKQTVERKIMWGDLDALGIVFYPRYYEWIDACSNLFFEAIDMRLDTLWEKRKLLFGLVETSSRYTAPGRYHQRVKITTEIEGLDRKTVEFNHVIARAACDTLMLTAREKRICLDVRDAQNIRAVDIPEDLFSVLNDAMNAIDAHQGNR